MQVTGLWPHWATHYASSQVQCPAAFYELWDDCGGNNDKEIAEAYTSASVVQVQVTVGWHAHIAVQDGTRKDIWDGMSDNEQARLSSLFPEDFNVLAAQSSSTKEFGFLPVAGPIR